MAGRRLQARGCFRWVGRFGRVSGRLRQRAGEPPGEGRPVSRGSPRGSVTVEYVALAAVLVAVLLAVSAEGFLVEARRALDVATCQLLGHEDCAASASHGGSPAGPDIAGGDQPGSADVLGAHERGPLGSVRWLLADQSRQAGEALHDAALVTGQRLSGAAGAARRVGQVASVSLRGWWWATGTGRAITTKAHREIARAAGQGVSGLMAVGNPVGSAHRADRGRGQRRPPRCQRRGRGARRRPAGGLHPQHVAVGRVIAGAAGNWSSSPTPTRAFVDPGDVGWVIRRWPPTRLWLR